VVITVLDETKKIGGVRTRVVEEREEENGELKEVSRNFFAICREHGDVFYFGEEVDDYEDGKLVGHSGAWRADEKDSRTGIIMPGTVLLRARHYQEIAPNAMDRAEVMSDDVTMKTPAGTFKNCIRVKETSGIDPEEKYYKTYAPGVGLIQDEDLLLTGYTKAKEESISLKDLPRAIRATIRKHAAGGEIAEIEKEMVKGSLYTRPRLSGMAKNSTSSYLKKVSTSGLKRKERLRGTKTRMMTKTRLVTTTKTMNDQGRDAHPTPFAALAMAPQRWPLLPSWSSGPTALALAPSQPPRSELLSPNPHPPPRLRPFTSP